MGDSSQLWPRGPLFLGLVASLLLLLSVGHAQPKGGAPLDEPADSTVALTKGERSLDQLSGTWTQRRESLAKGDLERATAQFERALRLQREAGVRRLDGFAISLLREALADPAQAASRLEQARAVAPGLPAILDVEARITLARTPWAIHTWFIYKVESLLARFHDFQHRMLLLSDFILGSLIVLCCLGAVFAFSQLLRYGLNLYFDLGTVFPGVMKFVLLAVVGLVTLTPLYFGFGPLLLFFPAVVLFWSYQSLSEKTLAVVFTLLLGASPWVVRMGNRLSEAGTGLTQAMHALSANPLDQRSEGVVLEAVAQDPKDWMAQGVLGLAEKRTGQLAEARAHLQAALAAAPAGPERGAIRANLGNVFFAEGRAKSAEAAYRAALEELKDERAAAVSFNLHRLYLHTGRKAEAAEFITQASKQNSAAVTAWNQDDDLHLNRYVVDLELSAEALTARALEDVLSPTPVSRRTWLMLAGPVPEMVAPLSAAAALLLFGVLTGLRERLRLSWPCRRCGQPALHSLSQGGPSLPTCERCESLFINNVPTERRLRFEKEAEIDRLETIKRWGTRVLGLLPGLAHLTRGRTFSGALLFAAALLLGLELVLPSGVLLEPVFLPPPGPLGRFAVMGALALVWLFGFVRALRWRN